MGKTQSPLRYPGGKSQIIDKVRHVIENNGYGERLYIEPFAGGFGVGLALLQRNVIHHAILNDSDQHLYHFWNSVFYHADDLISLVEETPITLEERLVQKEIFSDRSSSILQDGFATLYLNRVNYSGVLLAGPLGGNEQKSDYTLACRFNKKDIIKRIRLAHALSDRIQLFNLDASILITRVLSQSHESSFYNIDPPYVKKGKSLYSEYYTEQGHRDFGDVVKRYLSDVPWIITYDNCKLVRDIYKGYHFQEFDLFHSAHNRVRGTELVITNIPEIHFNWN